MDDAGDHGGMPRRIKVFGAIALALVFVALAILIIGGGKGGEVSHTGEGGDGSHTSGGDPGSGGDHGGDGNHSGPRDPLTWVVEVQDNAFERSDLTIQVGDTVQWIHAGSNGHTVTSDDDGETFDSHPDCNPMLPVVNCMANEDEFEHTFEEVGEVQYHCKVHASMTGTVTVLEQYNTTPDHHAQ